MTQQNIAKQLPHSPPPVTTPPSCNSMVLFSDAPRATAAEAMTRSAILAAMTCVFEAEAAVVARRSTVDVADVKAPLPPNQMLHPYTTTSRHSKSENLTQTKHLL